MTERTDTEPAQKVAAGRFSGDVGNNATLPADPFGFNSRTNGIVCHGGVRPRKADTERVKGFSPRVTARECLFSAGDKEGPGLT